MPRSGLTHYGRSLLLQSQANWLFPLAVALYITLFFNTHIYALVKQQHPIENVSDILFFFSIYCAVFFMVYFVTTLLSFGKLMKGWLIFLLLISATIAYIRDQYTVVFDEVMVHNIIETDANEAGELLSFAWLFYIILFGGLPAAVIATIPVKTHAFAKAVRHHLYTLIILAILLMAVMLPFHQAYTLLSASRLAIADHIAPTAFLLATIKYTTRHYPAINTPIHPVGSDAVLSGQGQYPHKLLMVIVVGESARSANFSLAGYPRQTNPLLEKRFAQDKGFVFYPNVTACSTSTVVSIPCMFSALTKNELDIVTEKHRENLLDVLAHAGFDIAWINNNAGCKNVCDRVRYIDMRNRSDDASCDEYGCADMALLQVMEDEIHTSHQHLVLVLHQKGSHGPAYYKRAPGMEKFTPACKANQLQACTDQEITNSYDNTIAYTDSVLDAIIQSLEKYQARYDAAMFYVSDHGESLGENGLHLHGMPLGIAPEEQLHIPALLWLSPGFRQRMNIDVDCLQKYSNKPYSHDYVFHTMLGLLDIRTTAYNSHYDISNPCRKNRNDGHLLNNRAID